MKEAIRQYGYRTLAEILSHVRGFYTTYDRNYTYIGVRGFARPGDYNTRVLLLVDGHRLNEPIYDMAPIGTDFPIDVSLIDRVEVIRGPGSSLYGTSAFFAVVNVITKSGGSAPGVRLDASVGSLATGGVNASIGRVFEGGNELLLAASGYRSRGNARLYYPEFDVPGVSDGVVTDADDDSSAGVSAVGHAGTSPSQRRVHRSNKADSHRLLPDDLRRFPRADGGSARIRGCLVRRAPYRRLDRRRPHRARLHVVYRGLSVQPGDTTVVQIDRGHALQASGELTLNRRARQHMFTLGGDVRGSLHNHQFTSDNYGDPVDESHPSSVLGFYAQDEVTLQPWLLLNAGVRLDYDRAFGANVAPRAGLVFLPGPNSSLKILYGGAFRAPNSYELTTHRR